jgi:hypothetical protein
MFRFIGPQNVTARAGYDNQPSFLPGGAGILYTSIRAGQADTYRYDIASRTKTQLTRTAESEYSPTTMPGGTTFSAVRVEADSTQRLWVFGFSGGSPRVILEDVQPVGYHAWANEYTVALFVLGSPPTLQFADLRTGHSQVVAHDIGRSIHKVPDRQAVSFLQRDSTSQGWISLIDLETFEISHLIQPVGDNEFYAWAPDGTILMGNGSKIFAWKDGAGAWAQVADFGDRGISNITRIAVSPDGRRAAIVAADASR